MSFPVKPGHLLARKRILALNAVIFALAVWGFAGEALRNRDLRQEIAGLQEQAAKLETDNSALVRRSQQIANTQTIEREARLKMNMMKPGESVVIIRGDLTAAADQTDVQTGAPATESNIHKWWRYFFH